jgi:hypothetical protein
MNKKEILAKKNTNFLPEFELLFLFIYEYDRF